MDYKIIADSCCDMTAQLRKRLGVITVPLTMRLGKKEFKDDEMLDLGIFMSEMKACTEKSGTAAPAPTLFQDAMKNAKNSFVVTLSSQLSGTYNNAVIGKSFAEEDGKTSVHVFDSKSACAGEVLIAIKIRELIQKGMTKDSIVGAVNNFIDNMKTYFVLEEHDNLLKNGRLGKMTDRIIKVLNIKMVMGADGSGNIKLFAKPRGTRQMIDRLLSFIGESGKRTDDENLVISHCNNPGLAEQLISAIERQFRFKEIFVIPTRGLSSFYTDDKGIVVAF